MENIAKEQPSSPTHITVQKAERRSDQGSLTILDLIRPELYPALDLPRS